MVSPLSYPPYIGGVESHVWEISKRLVKEGIDIEILSTDPTGKLEPSTDIDGIKIRRFPSFSPNGIYHLSRELFNALKNTRSDVIHSHGYQGFPMLASALAKKQNRIPLVITLHCGFSKVGRLPRLFYNSVFGNIIFSKADRIIVVSPIEIKTIIELAKYKQKLRIIPNGVDLKDIAHYLNKEQTDYDQPPINLLFAGRLEKKKGLVFLLKAFKTIKHKNVELTIVGDGPFKQKLDDLIQKAKLQNKVHIMERLSRVELYDLYAKSHIFLLLSEFEAHSIALTEALAFGLVPIVTNVGGNKFLVKNGTSGFLLDYPPDIEELSQILLRLVNNPKYMQSISENAKTQSRQFNIDVVVEQLCNIYQSITPDR